MKTRRIKEDIMICFKVLLTTFAIIFIIMLATGTKIYTGFYYNTGSKNMIITADNEPMYLTGGFFTNLDIGDKIFVITGNAIDQSYPASTTAYLCFKIKDGSSEDVPQSVLDTFIIRSD